MVLLRFDNLMSPLINLIHNFMDFINERRKYSLENFDKEISTYYSESGPNILSANID